MNLPVPARLRSIPWLVLLTGLALAGVPVQGQDSVPGSRIQPGTGGYDMGPGHDWVDNYQPFGAEQLVAEGRAHVDRSEYSQAEESFASALQIGRASSGLLSPSQEPLIDLLLETLLRQQKWREFDRYLDYLAWFHQRTLADDAESLAAGLLRQSDWHHRAAAVLSDNRSSWYLIQGKYLNWQAVSVLESAYGVEDSRLVPVLYRIALDHHYQAVSIQRQGMSSFEFKSDAKVITNGWSLTKNETVQRSYRIGRETLERIRSILAASSEGSTADEAFMDIYLADWELLFGNTDRALEGYRDAYWQLVEAGIPVGSVEEYFDQLVVLPMPDLKTRWEGAERRDNEAPLRVRAWSMVYPGTQTPLGLEAGQQNGLMREDPDSATVHLVLGLHGHEGAGNDRFDYRVTGLNVLDYHPRDERVLQRAFVEIPALRFRPRLADGELVAHDGVVLAYEFPELQP